MLNRHSDDYLDKYSKIASWKEFLANLAKTQRTAIVFSPVGGGIKGRIVGLFGDYLHMKIVVKPAPAEGPESAKAKEEREDPKRFKWTNIYLPMHGVYGVELEDESEIEGVIDDQQNTEI